MRISELLPAMDHGIYGYLAKKDLLLGKDEHNKGQFVCWVSTFSDSPDTFHLDEEMLISVDWCFAVRNTNDTKTIISNHIALKIIELANDVTAHKRDAARLLRIADTKTDTINILVQQSQQVPETL